MITPQCCEYAKTYLILRYEDAELYDRDFLLNNAPYWVVRGCKMRKDKIPSAVRYDEVKYCPSCRENMPEVRLISQLPENFRTVDCDGFVCFTCNERPGSCQCTDPLEMWQLANNKNAQ